MKLTLAVISIVGASAFAPVKFGSRVSTARSLGVDPSVLHDLPHHIDSLKDAFTSVLLSENTLDMVPEIPSSAVDTVTAAADTVAQAAAPDAAVMATDAAAGNAGDAVVGAAAASAVQQAADASSNSNGWFGFLTGPIEGLLQIIHSLLLAVGLSENSWGISIIAMTTIIKLLTFPLNKAQIESTGKMQVIQPQIKELQTKYQSNPEIMNQKITEVYQASGVNPLAGCLPSLFQIPVFIGLYRAVLSLAKDNKLNEPFLFLPNLEGPTYGADPAHGSDWILQGWVDGVPSLGWDDTIAFAILPVVLVVSQFVSMELMQPDNKDAQQQQPVILKFLPLMIGWFSLNVPAALCIYWVCNNVITTATTLAIRKSMAPIPSVGGATTMDDTPVFTPITKQKPSGFASSTFADAGIKPLTPVVDAEMVDDEDGDVFKDTSYGQTQFESGTGMGSPSSSTPKKRGGKKKKKN